MTNHKRYTIEHVKTWIETKPKLSPNLLFLPAKKVLSPTNSAEQLLLKYFSAIANHGKGSLVIGLTIRNKKVVNIEDIIPIDSSLILRIEFLLEHNISPAIEEKDIYFIETNQGKGILVITLLGTNRPYMVVNDAFYGLIDNRPYRLPESQIRLLYLTSREPRIEYVGSINTEGVPILKNGIPKVIQFYPKFLIRNTGTLLEKDYKVEFWFPSSIVDTSFNLLQNYFQHLDGPYSVYSIVGKTTLFQNEIYTILEAKLFIDESNINDFITMPFKVIIYYSKGKQEYQFFLNETFSYQRKPIIRAMLK